MLVPQVAVDISNSVKKRSNNVFQSDRYKLWICDMLRTCRLHSRISFFLISRCLSPPRPSQLLIFPFPPLVGFAIVPSISSLINRPLFCVPSSLPLINRRSPITPPPSSLLPRYNWRNWVDINGIQQQIWSRGFSHTQPFLRQSAEKNKPNLVSPSRFLHPTQSVCAWDRPATKNADGATEIGKTSPQQN